MEQVTVKELVKDLQELIKKGYGDRKIVLSDDNEGNGYHGMFYTCCVWDEDKSLSDTSIDEVYDSVTDKAGDLVILG